MVSRQEVPRALLTPGEVMQLPPSDSLIFVGGSPPIRARKLRYFSEPAFLKRVRTPILVSPPCGPGAHSDWDSVAQPPLPLSPAPRSSVRPVLPRRASRSPDAKQQAFVFVPAVAGVAAPDTAQPAVEPAVVIEDELGAAIAGPTTAIAAQFALDPDNHDPSF